MCFIKTHCLNKIIVEIAVFIFQLRRSLTGLVTSQYPYSMACLQRDFLTKKESLFDALHQFQFDRDTGEQR